MSWPVSYLGDVSEFIRNGASIPQSKDAGGVPITRIESISERIFNRNKCGYAGVGDSEYSEYRLRLGDILVSHINSEKHLAKCVIFEDEGFDVIHGMNLLCARPDQQKIFPKFLFHYLSSPKFLHLIPAITKKSVNQASFTVTAFKELPIPLPPLPEQKRIAAILDKADAIRRKRQQAIQLADNFLRAVFLDMFGDPVTNPKRWPVKALKHVSTKIGSGSTPRGGSEAYLEQGISLIRSLNIHDDEFRLKNLAFIDDEQAEKLLNVVVQNEDVLLNITGASVCRCAVVPAAVLPARVNQHVCIIRPSGLIHSSYLLHLLISAPYKQKLLKMSGAGATREALTKQQVELLEIPLPPKDLQAKFEGIKAKVKNLASFSESFKEESVFESLSDKAFSGQL